MHRFTPPTPFLLGVIAGLLVLMLAHLVDLDNHLIATYTLLRDVRNEARAAVSSATSAASKGEASA